ncbi:hypothetical protein C8Q69DRAFT_473596 [Paecilomyces variotii]|uniref:Uncharacterized protein n=1 Tax=Byssochlamys spectabilis TaxID=264951 RepID=A0A443HNR6_BYSSP|nr:hypothetical protein C8Q69DRAFT_473596 [Paecilomyces variotii]RWQ93455.1 hypothetical protein C8Q69DRAFT_473596 [Paecilomyces variotii]
MYSKWCTTLGNLKPTMFNCTWIATGQDQGRFFLGASLKGYSALLTIGTWASVVKAARFSLIDDEAMAMSGYTMNDCPEMRLTGNRIAFGNCAKTYPFLHILKRTDPATVHGIALHVRGVIPPAYEDNSSGEVWTNVRRLCANCQELVRMWGGNIANFEQSRVHNLVQKETIQDWSANSVGSKRQGITSLRRSRSPRSAITVVMSYRS